MTWVVRWLLCLYGISVGLPTIGLNVRDAATIRVDDIVVLILLPVAVVRINRWRSLAAFQRNAISLWIAIAGYCAISGMVFYDESHRDYLMYLGSRMLGCLALYVVIVVLVSDRSRVRWLLAGLSGGVVCLLIQVGLAIVAGQEMVVGTRYEWKASLAVGGLDTNYTASFSIIGIYVFGVLSTLSSRLRIPCIVGAIAATTAPIIMLARGVTIAVVAGWITYLAAARRLSVQGIVLLSVALATGFLSIGAYRGELAADAWGLDVRTGEGLSGRYDLWRVGMGIGAAAPLLGHGFGSETTQYLNAREIQRPRVSHFALLAVWVELGTVGVILFLVALLAPMRPYYRPGRLQGSVSEIRALGLAAFVAEMIYGFCYWVKVPMLCLALIAVLGRTLPRRSSRIVLSQPGA